MIGTISINCGYFFLKNLLQAKYYLDPYDVAEAEYTDKFGRLTRALQGGPGVVQTIMNLGVIWEEAAP